MAGIVIAAGGISSENSLRRFNLITKSASHRGREERFIITSTDAGIGVMHSGTELPPSSQMMLSLFTHRNIEDLIDVQTESLTMIDTATPKAGIRELLESRTSDKDSLPYVFNSIVMVVNAGGLRVLRSIDGTRPFHYCRVDGSVLLATDKKSLWAGGISNVKSLNPGCELRVSWTGTIGLEKSLSMDEIVVVRGVPQEQLIQSLKQTLLGSFSRLRDCAKCAVLFSGGVDSSLAGLLASKQCSNTVLISTHAKGSRDASVVPHAASLLALDVIDVPMNEKIVWNLLPEVIFATECTRRMDIEIALPFFIAAKEAERQGIPLVVSGQGPDELFAGYARHTELYENRGEQALEAQLRNEVSVTHKTNIERDERAISSCGVDAWFPYLDYEFVKLALSIPASLKIALGKTPERKIVFRELATELDLPIELAHAPKKATQYSSGAARILNMAIGENVPECRDLTKKQLNLRVQDVLNYIAKQLEMPIQNDVTHSYDFDVKLSSLII
ncbi:MAG: asparagine synthase C-terminal domain-containing protein [Candidatus Thorarchaeota archaeon]